MSAASMSLPPSFLIDTLSDAPAVRVAAPPVAAMPMFAVIATPLLTSTDLVRLVACAALSWWASPFVLSGSLWFATR